MGTDVDEMDERANNLVATGALFALLSGARDGTLTSVETTGGNQIDIGFSFLKSAYRLTVERLPKDDMDPVGQAVARSWAAP